MASGPAQGGSSITFTGTGFVSGASATIGGSACTLPGVMGCTSGLCTTLSCVLPSGTAGSASAIITNPDTQSVTYTGFTYVAAPTLTAVSPNNGRLSGGITLTLTGTGFQNGALAVKMGGSGGVACTGATYVDATHVTCTAPARSAAAYDVYLANVDGQNVTLSGGFTYNPLPTLSSVSPTAGTTAGGTSITLAGTGFMSGAQVTVGGSACTSTSLQGSTGITCTTPSGSAGAATIRVTNTDTQSVESTFTYIAPLTLSSGSTTCLSGGTLSLTAAGGTGGYTYSVVSGNATVNASTGLLSCGSPSGAVVARVADTRSVTQDLSLTVNPVAPTITLGSASYSGTKNAALSTISPTVTSEVQHCVIAPALPTGLSINDGTCAISGTPSVYSTSTAYSITVSNVTGTAAATFNLAINDVAPTIALGSGSYTKVRNQNMAVITPTLGGSVASVTISPSLPSGVALNGASGVISGTPSVTLAAAPYTLTASNNTGQTAAATFTFQINEVLSASVPYNTVAVSNTMNVAAVNGLSPYSYGVDNGTISAAGLYTAPGTSGTSVVSVTDSLGNTTTLSVTVNPALAISPTSANVEVNLTQAFTASDGVPPYTYALTAGQGSVVSNTYTAPATVGAGTATVRATDSVGNTASAAITIVPFCNGTKLTNAPFATGAAGTEADPSYICTATQLYAIDDDAGKLAAYYRLGDNIDLTGGPGVAIASSASPFSGTLDGQFYTLSNLSVSDSANDYKGLFAAIGSGGLVQKLLLSSITIVGKTKVGGVAGTSVGTIQKVAVQGTSRIEGSTNVVASDVGGIVGYLNKPGVVDQAKVGSSVTIRNTSGTTVESIGGIAGRADGTATTAGNFATIQNSYSLAQVLTPGQKLGGIVGYVNFTVLKNNYFAGVADDTGGGTNEGGILGFVASAGSYSGNVFDSTVCATNCTFGMPAGNRAATTTLMKSVGTYLRKGWDFVDVWSAPSQAFTGQYPALRWESGISQMSMTFGGGNGTEGSPYQISNAAQLESLMLDTSKWSSGSSFTLTANIDLGGIELAPIGNTTTAFSGTLDGGFHTISNFAMSGTADDTNVGLFGNVGVSGVVRNLLVSGFTITGNTKVGAIAGTSTGTIQKVAVTGTSLVQGLSNTTFSDIGGIVGYLNKPGLVDQSKTDSGVTVRNNAGTSAEAIGGIAGYADGTATSAGNCSTIQNSYSLAQVLTPGFKVGGIVGLLNYATLKNNYFAGVADDTGGGSNEGGILGAINFAGTYSGNLYDSTVCSTNCTLATAAGYRGATTTLMKSVGTYLRKGWDFANVWSAPSQAFTGQYPALLWESGITAMPTAFGGGDGTDGSPYQISNAAQLESLMLDTTKWSSGSSFTITADINLGGIEIAPIGNTTTAFSGTLDGGFHTISNFGINGTADDTNIGLFGNVGASGLVRNLILSGVTVVGNTKVGAVAGTSSGTIQKVAVTGTSLVDGLSNTNYSDIGGIVGYLNKPGLVDQCKSDSNVTVRNNSGSVAEAVGGIVGYADGTATSAGNFATIQNSYSLAQVLSPGSKIGGIIGYLNYTTLKNNYFAGVADDTGGSANEGGIMGAANFAGTYSGNVYDSTVCATNCTYAMPAGNRGAATALVKSVATYLRKGWDFSTVWTTPGQVWSGQYPKLLWEAGQSALTVSYAGGNGSAGSPYQISNAAELQSLMLDSTRWNGTNNFLITANITLGGVELTPIGNATTPFTGTLDGGGRTISGFAINGTVDDTNLGLVGYLGSAGTVKNLLLSGFTITGNTNVGGVAGTSIGTIQKVAVLGTSLVEGYLNAAVANVGGVVGYLYKPGLVEQAKVGSEVTVRSQAASGGYIGGIAGYINGTANTGSNYATVQNSYSLAQVTTPGQKVGGIVGFANYGLVKNNYFVGFADDTSGITDEGGVIGSHNFAPVYSGNFYDSTVCSTGCTTAGPAGTQAANTTLMQSVGTFTRVGWDFYSTWTTPGGVFTGQYPVLAWESGQSLISLTLGGGAGTSVSPFTISNATHLNVLMTDYTQWNTSNFYLLTADIDLGGAEVSPVGSSGQPFAGTFDGGSHTISNFKITGTTDDTNVGLFGVLASSATVKNLVISGATVKGSANVGGIAGSSTGTIQKVAVQGTSVIESLLNAAGSYTGGIVGYLNKPGLLDQVKVGSGVTVKNTGASSESIGGLAGKMDGTATTAGNFSSIQNSYSQAQVQSPGSKVGGVVGFLNWSSVKNTYFAGVADDTNGGSNEGGIIGFVNNIGTYSGNFYDSTVCATNCSTAGPAGTRSATTTLMKSVGTYLRKDWDFKTVWSTPGQVFSNQYPVLLWESGQSALSITFAGGTGSSGSPYLISDAATLEALMIDTSKWSNGSYFRVTADIDLAGLEVSPIGRSTTGFSFTGNLDGQNHIISNFAINGTLDDDNIGLFGYIGAGGVVQNLILSSVTIRGNTNVGGVAGSSGGTIQKVAMRGTSLIESLPNGNAPAGGFVGYLFNPGLVDQVAAVSSVTVKNTAGTGARLGGIVGQADGVNTSSPVISNSYSRGTVTTPGVTVGGIVGYLNYGKVSNCYFSGISDDSSGNSSEGGVVGTIGNTPSVLYTYYDSTVCASASSQCSTGYTTGTTALSTTNIQDTSQINAAWDFNNVWLAPGSAYFTLRWEP